MANRYENLADLWKKIEDVKIGMFTTLTAQEQLHARPMTALEVDADGVLWFYTSLHSELAKDISRQPLANISFAEPKDSFYVSLSGQAEFISDRKQYERLWSPMIKAWFPRGIDDPDLVLIRFRIADAAYWDSDSSRMVQMLKMLTAAVTGNRPDMGAHGQVRM